MSTDPNFRDVERQLAKSQGVLAGDAWSDQERVDDAINPDKVGWDFMLRCQTCGRLVKVTTVWGELIVASVGLIPQDADSGQAWIYHQGFMYPPITCGCGKDIHVPLTPDKAQRFLKVGIDQRILDANWVEQQRKLALSRAPQRR